MMQLARKASLVVVLFLLAWVGAAFSESAWVLWQESEIKMPDKSAEIEWADPVAYSDRAACVAAINDHVKRWKEAGSPMLRAERTSTETTAESRSRFKSGEGWTAVRFRCLPDTVDPRGPKGSAVSREDELATAGKNPLADWSDDRLVAAAYVRGATPPQAAEVEIDAATACVHRQADSVLE